MGEMSGPSPRPHLSMTMVTAAHSEKEEGFTQETNLDEITG